jgi:primosomal protein N' (replication factor Y)
MTLYAEVILPLPLGQTFWYKVPDVFQAQVQIGSRVLVPFGTRTLTGFIVNTRTKGPKKELEFKEVSELLDEKPVFSPSFLSFSHKLSEFYYSSWGELLQASLPPTLILKTKTKISLSEKGEKALEEGLLSDTEKGLAVLLKGKTFHLSFLKKRYSVKNIAATLSRMEKKGLIDIQKETKKRGKRRVREIPPAEAQLEIDFSLDLKALQVAGSIAGKLGKREFSPFYVYGPREKREAIYFYLIKEILAQSAKVLFLVPEISLTEALVKKFQERLGEKVVLLHSQMAERKRENEWLKIMSGEREVLIGPRSALLTPVEGLRLIIVDEEQDESYFQLEHPSYDARMGAWLRARQEKAVLVYGSSLPSVEAFYKAQKNGYLMDLESEPRKANVSILDDKKEKEMIGLSLKQAIRKRLERKEHVLVFINRRGYATSLICSRCHYIPKCRQCDIALSYHKREKKLVCRYCNYTLPEFVTCPECGGRLMRPRGMGIEAIEEELQKIFPQVRVSSFDSEVIKTKEEQAKILQGFQEGALDILVGTPLLAHQIDLPPVSLIAIFYPEILLSLSDYRASQKTFQTLSRMIGFLGGGSQAEVFIQTALPQHFSIQCAASGDYLSFFNQEIEFRRMMSYPPFFHVVEVVFQGPNLRILAKKTREFSGEIKSRAEKIEILGPALASVSKVRGLNRIQMIFKSRSRKELDKTLSEPLAKMKLRKSVLVWG